MTIQEFYQEISGSYAEAVGRMMKDTLVQRFALKFSKDPSFAELKQSMEAGDMEAAFRAAHTLKGVCKNLAFTKLADSATEITELLRMGDIEKSRELFPVVQADYENVLRGLEKLDA